MTDRDDDILEFDFFDEPPTVERQQTSRVRMPRRRRDDGEPPRPPRRSMRPPHGFTPLLRLVGLIAFAILIVVLLVFWVQSCQSSSKRNSYRDYMQDVAAIATASQSVGRDLATALTTPGAKEADVITSLTSLAQREQQNVAKAEELSPPGPLRIQNRAVVQALQFRLSGLQGLAATFRNSAGTAAASGNDAASLAAQSQRFVASDVVWDDVFHDPAATEMREQDVTGIQVPDSNFIDDAELTTAGAWEPILQRLRGASTGGTGGGGPHGTALAFVKALPSGDTLSADTENTITATTDLGFSVGVQDSGNAQEVGIEVTLTIQKSPQPIVKTQKIQVIDPGQTKTLVFRNLGQVPFATKTTLKVDIAPVPSEANSANNSATYPVIFSLG